MPQYILIAEDFKHPDALAHRMQVRPRHLEYAKNLREKGQLIIGGARLDQESQMTGSVAIFDFEREVDLQNYLNGEPYILEKVWEKYHIERFRVANV